MWGSAALGASDRDRALRLGGGQMSHCNRGMDVHTLIEGFKEKGLLVEVDFRDWKKLAVMSQYFIALINSPHRQMH